jgi:3-methyladenine DNA glycosylase AlkD
VEQVNKYIKQVEYCLTKQARKKSETELRSLAAYLGTRHKMLGLGTALQKQLAKQNYGIKAELHHLLPAFDKVFGESSVFEIKSASLLFLDAHYKKLDKKELLTTIPAWVDHVDNWAHSDYLSKFYTRFLEEEATRKRFLPTLEKWNRDKNPWKRRQSMVALMYYARTRKNHLPFQTVISFIKPHLEAPEYFVQKGLGWSLRECYNVYPGLTYKFMEQNYSRVSSVAFSAACEKMTTQEKENLKLKRKKHRAKK